MTEPILVGVPSTDDRAAIGRALIASGISGSDLEMEPDLEAGADATLTADLAIPFPAGLGPVPRPPVAGPATDAPLPHADVLLVTWTVAEQNAMADVLTPGYGRNTWYRYDRNFAKFKPRIRSRAPAAIAQRLGSWFPITIGPKSVICFKSELHLNQDSIPTGDGTATLPVADLFRQLIAEVMPKVVLTVGTSGATFPDHDLGDVVVTRGAKFRLADEFRNETFAQASYRSDWEIPTTHFAAAETLMAGYARHLVEPPLAPPTKHYPFPTPTISRDGPNTPDIKLDGRDMPAFHPILTTDFFEFGTSANGLEKQGCAVEMGDAVLGLVAKEMPAPPHWAAVRNLSDPQINADLPTGPGPLNMQTHWAVWYYEAFGYWTSVTGALATWAIVAGLKD